MADNLPQLTKEYIAADNGGQTLLNVTYAMMVLTTVFLGLFYASRYYNSAAIGPAMFWIIQVAYVFNMANLVLGLVGVQYGGMGRHLFALDPSTQILWGKLAKAGTYLCVITSAATKIPILAFYLQIFPGRLYRYIIYLTGSVLFVMCLANSIQASVICRPFDYYWKWSGPGGCGDLDGAYRWPGIPQLVTDVIVLILPFPVIFKLQVSFETKVGLTATFLTASMGIIACIMRVQSFFVTSISEDSTWLMTQPTIWTEAQPSAYLISSILPTLRQLVILCIRSSRCGTHTFATHKRNSGLVNAVLSRTVKKTHLGAADNTAASIELNNHSISSNMTANGPFHRAERKGFERLNEIEGGRRKCHGSNESHLGITCTTDVRITVEKDGRPGSVITSTNKAASVDSVSKCYTTTDATEVEEDEMPLRKREVRDLESQ